MVRFASGAFVTSPILSVMAEAGTLPFELLAAQSTARIAIRLLEKHRNSNNLPLMTRVSDQLQEITGAMLPTVGQVIRRSDREWHTSKPSIIWDVKKQVRAGDPPGKVRPIVQHLIASRFGRSTVIFTDGSKSENTVGAGLYGNGIANTCSLPENCSVFSAEAYALRMAVLIPNIHDLLIVTDSASCLLALEAGQSKHPWIQEVEQIARNKLIRFCWIPGHAGVHGNDEADRLANEARRQAPTDVPLPAEDAMRAVKKSIRRHWDRQWFTSRDAKLREVKYHTYQGKDRDNAADQRVLTRLRIGHTRLTHSFLLEKEAPPICECCGTTLDVRHIILHCRKFEDERQQHGVSTTSLQSALCNNTDDETKLLNYLTQSGLFNKL